MDDPSNLTVRTASAVLVLGLLLAACGTGGDPPRIGQGTSSSVAAAETEGSGPVATSSGGAPVATSDGIAPGQSTAMAARRALDRYLDAVAANDFDAAVAASDGALRSLTEVRKIVHAGNSERGGSTASRYTERSFEVSVARDDEVRFRGRAVLTSVVSGPGSPPASTTDTLGDVAVQLGAGGWRATKATYNDRPVLPFAADAATSVGAVRLELTGAVAFGSSLAVVLRLVAHGEHAVAVAGGVLRVGDGEAPSTRTVIVSGQPGFVLMTFPRRDQRPTSWRATVTVDGTSHTATLAF